MLDIENFKAEIEVRLKDAPQDKCVVFAVRSAMRVLPVLAVQKKAKLTTGKREPFWFWQTEYKNKHLLAILMVYSCGVECVLTEKYNTYTNVFVDAFNAANAAASGFAFAMDVYAYSAAYAASAYASSAYAHASAYAAYASAVSASIIQEIRQDLATLEKKTAKELFRQPLWSKAIPADWQQCIADFKTDMVSLNAGFEVWIDQYEDYLQGKQIDIELLKQWNSIPTEIQEQGVVKVNAYLKSLLQKNTTQPLNRVRAIFIGYGEAGKTSLIRALHDEEVVKGKEDMTPGIDICDWKVPDTDIQAHFWDFGGQVVFYSTHKFFLRSSCVYIIVINARADINSSEQAEYWLEHVKVFGDSAPVLLVGNKVDESQIHLQMQTLSQKYPNIKGFYPLSCTHAKTSHRYQFESFKQALAKELQAVGLHQVLFSPAQAKILDELGQTSPDHAFLSESEFNQLCDKHGISNEGELNRDWLVDIFDKLGVMLHFEELKTFHNAYMLNPRWLTHGVYTLMNAKQARLNDKDMVRILANTPVKDEYQHLLSYPPDKCLFISKVMQRFKLCYPLPNEANTLLIPALLNDELPSYPPEVQDSDTLRFEFAFTGFLPRNLIGEFMVSRHKEIKDGWQSQRGAVFASKSLQAQALVEADYHRRLLVMQLYGIHSREYLTILYDAMLTVFGELDLDYREWVNLPISACLDKKDKKRLRFNRKVEKAPYKQLLACAKKQQFVYIAESGLSYDVGKVLDGILTKAEQAKHGITNNFYNSSPILSQKSEVDMSETTGDKTVTTINQNVTNSTVHGSVIAAETIENSFNNLQASKADNKVKALLEQLLIEIKDLNNKVPPVQTQAVENIAKRADTLITESKSENPDTAWYQLSLKGIKDAAITLKEIGEPVLKIATELSSLLLG